MKICFMCDLHLPFNKTALQYDVMKWAADDIIKKQPDCIVFAGDVTCDGAEDVYDYFIEVMTNTKIPFLYIPGNSDLRNKDTCKSIKEKSSTCKNEIGGQMIYAVNDSDRTISDEQYSELCKADENSIVFMHHPLTDHKEATFKLIEWRKNHPQTMVFYGHLHCSECDENSVSLQAMDPDKAIGESPCITYYDTETKSIRKAYYFSPVPTDLYDFLGVSCYNPVEHIKFAIDKQLKNIELRPNCADYDNQEELFYYVEKWREVCGENLAIHLSEVSWLNGKVNIDNKYDKLIDIAKNLKANRITQHVPVVSVKETKENPKCLAYICERIAEKMDSIEHDIVIGIENMHMTSSDKPDETRRFGYTPEECIEFMHLLSSKCRHKVGINFDIGHARNNSPYSQKYQISTWLSMIGKYAVGYHIHQVTFKEGKFENHMPITDIYGHLISYACFFRCWSSERINKVPFIFEMRPSDAYQITFNTFDEQKRRKVFDIHSHTDYSFCGRDNPHDLIKTAINNGISIFGICDHNYGIGARKAEYLKEIRNLAEEYKDRIKIFCGIEIATYPEWYDIKNPAEIKGYDYCLIEHLTEENSFVKGDMFEFCKNLGILCGIAHTDLFKYCDMYGFEYKEFFEKMAQNNIFWEMNVSYDSIHKYSEHQYVLDFINDEKKQKIIKDAGVYISVGFDSHRCEDYDGYIVHKMYDFLKRNNFNTIEEILM